MKALAISLGLAALLCGPAVINPGLHEASAAEGAVVAKKTASKAYKVKAGVIVVNTYAGGTLDAALNDEEKHYDQDAFNFLEKYGISLKLDKNGIILDEKLADGVTAMGGFGTDATAAMPANVPAGSSAAAMVPAGSTVAGAAAAETAAALTDGNNNAVDTSNRSDGISVSK